ncbi:MAG: AAA family ATPase [Thermomicrobiales bacterium]|nr:AAA family ATPase [Thermomicrobiales bacterium]
MLEDAWRLAKGGRSRFVLVGGMIGIGKTTFVRQFLARHPDAQAITCTCLELVGAPARSIWHDLLSDSRHHHALSALQPPTISGYDDETTDAVVAWFEQVTQIQPTILFIDDLHWADADSLTLLRRVAVRLRDAPLLMIATYRDSGRDQTSPFHLQLAALLRETDVTQVVLPPLDEQAISRAIANAFPLTPADLKRLSTYIQRYGQGNLLAIHELLNALQREGILAAGDGVNSHWRLGDLSRVVVPPTAHSIVDGLVARTGDAGKALLEVASVFGHQVRASRFALWRELAGLDEQMFRDAIERSLAVGMLVDGNHGSIEFAHPLARESMLMTLAGSRRMELHRRIGEYLSQVADPEVEEVAHHLYSGRHPAALDWLLRAAERAQAMGDWTTAALRLEDAARLARVVDGQALAAGWMTYRAAVLLRFTDLSRAIKLLESARALALDIGDVTLSAGTRYHLGFLKCWDGQIASGLAEMAAAITDIEALSEPEFTRLQLVESFGSREYGEHRGTLIGWYALAGRYRDALELSAPFVESLINTSTSQPRASRNPVADGYAGRAASQAMLGDPDRAVVSSITHRRRLRLSATTCRSAGPA